MKLSIVSTLALVIVTTSAWPQSPVAPAVLNPQLLGRGQQQQPQQVVPGQQPSPHKPPVLDPRLQGQGKQQQQPEPTKQNQPVQPPVLDPRLQGQAQQQPAQPVVAPVQQEPAPPAQQEPPPPVQQEPAPPAQQEPPPPAQQEPAPPAQQEPAPPEQRPAEGQQQQQQTQPINVFILDVYYAPSDSWEPILSGGLTEWKDRERNISGITVRGLPNELNTCGIYALTDDVSKVQPRFTFSSNMGFVRPAGGSVLGGKIVCWNLKYEPLKS